MNGIAYRGFRRWMVVDDDATLSDMMSLMLHGLGLAEVESFTSPLEALARFNGIGGRFDLVVTDRDMPGMDGLDFARRLRAKTPRIQIVLVTAHADDLQPEELEAAGITSVLGKPFSPLRLESLVRALVSKPVNSAGPSRIQHSVTA